MKKALFFGDSNTYGYDPAGFMGGRYPRDARWTTILEGLLAEQGTGESWQIADDGMPGRALPVTRWEWEYLTSLLRRETPLDLFAVMLGTNDLLSTLRPDPDRTARRMNDMLTFVENVLVEVAEEAGSEGPAPQILLIAPPRIRLTEASFGASYVSGDMSCAQMYYDAGRKLAENYAELAKWRQIRFADASTWELDFAYDGVHLSEKGHLLFAKQMAEVLRGDAQN